MTVNPTFTSGLPIVPNEKPQTAAPHPKGYAMLMAIRERAEGDQRLLEPLTRRRFDGEWLEPDADDIAAHAIACAVKQLIDWVVSDGERCAEASLRLGRIK